MKYMKHTLHIQLTHFSFCCAKTKSDATAAAQYCDTTRLATPKQDGSLRTDSVDDICSLLLQLECYMCVLSPCQCGLIALSWPNSLWTHCPKPLCSQSTASQWPALSGWLALSNHLDGLLRAGRGISGESVARPQRQKENCILFINYSAIFQAGF